MTRKFFVRSGLAALAMLLSMTAQSQVTSETHCFENDSKASIKFELRTYYDAETKFAFGYVVYNRQKNKIPLVLGSRFADSTSPGRPDTNTDKWLEVVDGAVAGSYDMVSQGNELVSMSYTNFRTKKVSSFGLDPNASSTPGDDCGWRK